MDYSGMVPLGYGRNADGIGTVMVFQSGTASPEYVLCHIQATKMPSRVHASKRLYITLKLY